MDKDKFLKDYGYAVALGGGTLVVLLILSFFVVVPLYKGASNLTLESKAKQEELDSLKAKKVALDSLKGQEKELSASAEKVMNALPQDKDAGRMFIQVDESVKQSGGTVRSVTESGGQLTETVSSGIEGVSKISYVVPLSLPGYSNLKDFLVKTEAALRLVNIDNIEVNQGSTGSMDVTIQATTYSRK